MVTTICMNPAFDRTLTIDRLTPGGLNRVRSARKDVGGKGINVARVLRRLGTDVQCLGMAGMESMDAIQSALAAEGLTGRFLPVPGEVRTNTKLLSTDTGEITELNEAGPETSPEAVSAFMRMTEEACGGSEWAVLTGSLPPGCPPDTYRTLICRLHGAGVRCLLDVGGEPLLQGLEACPEIIKPNRLELEQAVGHPLPSLEAVRQAGLLLLRSGAGSVVVSLGGEGAVLVTPGGCWRAPALRVPTGSTVGAGDSMVAGMLAALSEGAEMEEAFRCGVAAATASVMTDGTQLVRPEDYAALLPRVRLQAF